MRADLSVRAGSAARKQPASSTARSKSCMPQRAGRSTAVAAASTPYETAAGTRWRCALKRSDGSYTSKRGFTSKKAATDSRRRLIEKQERGELRHTKLSFADFWTPWLDRRKPHLEPGTGRRTSETGGCDCCPRSDPYRLKSSMSRTSAR